MRLDRAQAFHARTKVGRSRLKCVRMTRSSRRLHSAAGVGLTIHTLGFFVFDRYRQLMADVGDLFSHATDVADLPRLLLIGFVIVGAVAVTATVLLERWLWWLTRRP
jgi:hypothetical protein